MDNNPYSFTISAGQLFLVKTGGGSPTYFPIVPEDRAPLIMEAMAEFLARQDFGE